MPGEQPATRWRSSITDASSNSVLVPLLDIELANAAGDLRTRIRGLTCHSGTRPGGVTMEILAGVEILESQVYQPLALVEQFHSGQASRNLAGVGLSPL